MRQMVVLAVTAILLSTSLLAAPHASREQVLGFLRREGIIAGKTRVVEATWSEDAHRWFVSLRHPSGKISNWTVDADARDYHYVCKN
jgi:formate dehydrogenase assembly factor FdhD